MDHIQVQNTDSQSEYIWNYRAISKFDFGDIFRQSNVAVLLFIYTYIFWGIKQTLLSKATYSNSYIHSYIDGGGCHARCPPAHQEQFGGSVSCLRTLGHADQGNRTSDLLSHSHPLLAWVVCLPNYFTCANWWQSENTFWTVSCNNTI